jgi:hypothetical protein
MQSNIIQHGSTSAVHAAGIARSSHTQDKRKVAEKIRNEARHALPRSFTRFLRLAKISPMVARNASVALTALLRQILTLLFHRVANRVANFVASGAASRDYHLLQTRC